MLPININFSKKLPAFTLAEVLITLVMIGVIAAMTIPTLIRNMNNIQYGSSFKKTFSAFSQAVNKITQDNGGSIKELCDDSICFRNLLTTHLSVIKSCDKGYSDGCRYSGATGQNGQVDSGFSWAEDVPAVVLNDGNILQFYLASKSCADPAHGCGFVTIDVNGMKPPNREGQDVYFIHIQDGFIQPFGTQSDGYSDDCDTNNSMGWTCAKTRLLN